MNFLDLFIVLALFLALLLGMRKGFLRQFFSLAGVLFGAFLAFRYHVFFVSAASTTVPFSGQVIAFFLLFSVGIMVAAVLNRLLGGIIAAIRLRGLDKMGGATLGLLKGWILVSVASFFLVAVVPAESAILCDSILLPWFLETFSVFQGSINGEVPVR